MTRRNTLRPAFLSTLLLILPAAASAQTSMQLGFYVDSGVPCAQASNATIALVRKTGINTSRVSCTFTSITPVRQNLLSYTETCTDISDPVPYASSGTLELLGPTRFHLERRGWETTKDYCPQSEMPEFWRHNDLSSMLE